MKNRNLTNNYRQSVSAPNPSVTCDICRTRHITKSHVTTWYKISCSAGDHVAMCGRDIRTAFVLNLKHILEHGPFELDGGWGGEPGGSIFIPRYHLLVSFDLIRCLEGTEEQLSVPFWTFLDCNFLTYRPKRANIYRMFLTPWQLFWFYGQKKKVSKFFF